MTTSLKIDRDTHPICTRNFQCHSPPFYPTYLASLMNWLHFKYEHLSYPLCYFALSFTLFLLFQQFLLVRLHFSSHSSTLALNELAAVFLSVLSNVPIILLYPDPSLPSSIISLLHHIIIASSVFSWSCLETFYNAFNRNVKILHFGSSILCCCESKSSAAKVADIEYREETIPKLGNSSVRYCFLGWGHVRVLWHSRLQELLTEIWNCCVSDSTVMEDLPYFFAL